VPYEDKSRYLDSPCILPIGDEENIFPERGGGTNSFHGIGFQEEE